MSHSVELFVNVDHVATLRQARRADAPDPVEAARLARLGGATGITFHLREDRRHIQDADVRRLFQSPGKPLNFELGAAPEIVALCAELRPTIATLVPEKRQELTTEGGLPDAALRSIGPTIERLRERGIVVSLFIDPEPEAVRVAKKLGADRVEIHTGYFSDAHTHAMNGGLTPGGAGAAPPVRAELERIWRTAAEAAAQEIGLTLGHGLSVANLPVAMAHPSCRHVTEVSIGHSIVARAIVLGMCDAVAELRGALEHSVAALRRA